MSTVDSEFPNVLLIIADDLGRDVVQIRDSASGRAMKVVTQPDVVKDSPNGSRPYVGELPNLSLLLRNGLYFGQAWAQPVCSPTRASIYTGTHPWKNGVGYPSNPQLDRADVTALPLVVDEKYACGLFGKWHLGDTRATRPTAHGWDRHAGTLAGVVPDYTEWTKYDSCHYMSSEVVKVHATKDTVDEASRWIESLHDDTPWFVTIAFHSPHSPFELPPDGTYSVHPSTPIGDEDEDFMFNAMAQNMDFHVGRLLGANVETGPRSDPAAPPPIPLAQLENTVIVFIGDNGSDAEVAIEEPKTTIYEGGVRVPFIVADGLAVARAISGQPTETRLLAPDKIDHATGKLAHVVDLYRTIAELAGADPADLPDNLDSQSLVPLFTESGPTQPVRMYNFSQCFKGEDDEPRSIRRATIRNRDYKLNYDADLDPSYALYKYEDGEIPGEEGLDAVDLGTGKGSADAVINRSQLLQELERYQVTSDPDDDFPEAT